MVRARSFFLLFLISAAGKTISAIPLIFSWGHHSASALPFYGALSLPLNPSLRFGTEWGYGEAGTWEGRRISLLQGLDLEAFRNPFHGTGASVTTRGILRANTRWGMFFGLSIDAGCLHVFYPRKTFKSNGDGTFGRSASWGRPSAVLGSGLHLGYHAFRFGRLRLYPRLDYSYSIQYPYNDLIPVFPHNLLRFGFNLTLGNGGAAGTGV